MLVIDVNEMLLWLHEIPGCGNPTLPTLQKETKIGKNVLYSLAKNPTGLVKIADLDELLNFFFKRLAKAEVFLGPPEHVAAEVLTRLVRWYPNDDRVFNRVYQSLEIRDVFSKYTPMPKDISLSDAFWVEYRRVHKDKPRMVYQPKPRMGRQHKNPVTSGKSKPFATIKVKQSTPHSAKRDGPSKLSQKRH